MITVINKSNKGLYNQLFEQVQDWLYTHNQLGEEIEAFEEGALLGKTTVTVDGVDTEVPETLTSLEELFSYMRFITRFAPIYTRLPLDEEPFFIDADSREISVPKDFAANGVSVQGDEVSEILFFKINRFFDAQDLNLCKIFIQWRSADTDEFGNPLEGVSRPWIQDIESEPGYLIFGWPISSKITSKPGNITFSVRFYRLDPSDKLIYSFSTLDQNVTIKPALDYDIEDIANDSDHYIIDDMASNIMTRAENSPVSAGNFVALKPYWEAGVEDGLKGWTAEYKADGTTIKYEVMNLNIDPLTGFSNVPVVLVSKALSDDSGVVSYTWTKVDKNENATLYMSDGETKFYKPVEYVVTDVLDGDRIVNKTYYYKDGNKFKAIAPTTEDNPTPFADLRAEDKDIYELVSTATLDEVGKYVAIAENRVGKVFSEALIANTIYVPMPVEPELGELIGLNGKILRDNPVELDLEVVLKDQFGNDVSGQGGKATYVWRRRGLEHGSTPEVLEDTSAQLILTPNGENEAELEGWYSVIVTNNLNKEALSSTSNEIRVTKPATKLTLGISTSDDISIQDAQSGISVSILDGEEPNREDEDSITYQWYRYIPFGSDVEADKAAAREGNYELHGDAKIEDLNIDDSLTQANIDSSTTPTLIPPIAGMYFCLVTNRYNGTEAVTISPFYNVVG